MVIATTILAGGSKGDVNCVLGWVLFFLYHANYKRLGTTTVVKVVVMAKDEDLVKVVALDMATALGMDWGKATVQV